MKYLLTLFILAVSLSINAQTQTERSIPRADIDEAARNYYNRYEEFFAQQQNDSAAYYIKLRADLDTTNVMWQLEAGRFIQDYIGDLQESIALFYRTLRQAIAQYGEQGTYVSAAYNNIGLSYHYIGNYALALEYYNKALPLMEASPSTKPQEMVVIYNNLGDAYYANGDYTHALEYYSKSWALQTRILGINHPNTVATRDKITSVEYLIALSNGTLSAFLENKTFTIVSDAEAEAARQQGLKGEYILLELNDWQQYSTTSLFDKIQQLQGKPKTLLLMKDGAISRHQFANSLGVLLGVKQITPEERQRINAAYELWKQQNTAP